MAALTLAVPNKGRLLDPANAYFTDAGVALTQSTGARGYRATLAGLPDIEVLLLSAGDIATSLASGDVHLGVTGEDLLREQSPQLAGRIHLVKPLGFGFTKVVVAVPQYWIDVSTMTDLDDVCAAFARKNRRRLRIATKYQQITRSFFADKGISDYRIVESEGATEGAPSTGAAEAIVDITTTGATLVANGLKVLEDGVIFESEAQLAASLYADWDSAARAAAEALLARLGARERARNTQILRVRLDRNADTVLAELERAARTSILARPGAASGEYALLCPKPALKDAVALLRAQGCTAPVAIQDAEYVFDAANPLYAALRAALA